MPLAIDGEHFMISFHIAYVRVVGTEVRLYRKIPSSHAKKNHLDEFCRSFR